MAELRSFCDIRVQIDWDMYFPSVFLDFLNTSQDFRVDVALDHEVALLISSPKVSKRRRP
jgi:hypothetical protein